ncbi:hypothetical protein CASFOL_043054 [Castilleja foliolosa]|uniref:BPM/SPOP BACK domain-containing protein n=1 Tax=Castilleja foliolosa TaxID=1961234 RepID=A0ABD3B7I5_9LAMI
MADDLLAAADKLRARTAQSDVRRSIMRVVISRVSSRHAHLADLHSADQLKAQTIDFINTSHATDVMDTPGWKNMISSHPHLIAEAFRALATQQQQIPPSARRASASSRPSPILGQPRLANTLYTKDTSPGTHIFEFYSG